MNLHRLFAIMAEAESLTVFTFAQIRDDIREKIGPLGVAARDVKSAKNSTCGR